MKNKKILNLNNLKPLTPMIQSNLTAVEQSVLNVVKNQHLPSYEILKKVDNVSMLLSLYNVIDGLQRKGKVKSYIKENVKYHFACN